MEITIRRATAMDSSDLLAWRNDPETIAASISPHAVAPSDHAAWLTRALEDELRALYLAVYTPPESAARNIGMVRFDLTEDASAAEVSINLAPESRGLGLSEPVLRAAIETFRTEFGPLALTATIRHENGASHRVFAGIGFQITGSADGLDRLAANPE